MSLDPEISLVIPALNEKESLPALLTEIVAALSPLNTVFEVLIVDDGSHDGTFEFLCNHSKEYPWLKALRFRQNMGKAAALQAGFSHSRGKYVFTLDADLQDDPAEVPHMLVMLKADCDMVSGWKKKRFDPWHKTLPSKLFNRTVRAASGLALHDFNCGLKGYRREVIESISLYGELHRYIPVLAHWNGFRVAEKVVSHRARKHGTSKYGWTRLSNGLFDLLTLLFLHRYMARPLHLFGFLGLLSGLIGTMIIAGFSLQWLVTGSIHMRPLLLGGISAVLLGVQFVSIGLIAELIVGRLPSAPPRLDMMPGENK